MPIKEGLFEGEVDAVDAIFDFSELLVLRNRNEELC